MTNRPFRQVDVFATVPYVGNPVAVVLDADGLDDEQMQRFARWTNLSETTFVLPPRPRGPTTGVRIFTPVASFPFAGHPTLGTCHAWLEAGGGTPKRDGVIVQECAAGSYAAPDRGRAGVRRAADAALRAARRGATVAHVADVWASSARRSSTAAVGGQRPGLGRRAARGRRRRCSRCGPGYVDLDVGVVGPRTRLRAEAFEVRAFYPVDGAAREDPVTGSLNASLASGCCSTGRAQRAVRGQPGHGARPGGPRAHHPRGRRAAVDRRPRGDVRRRGGPARLRATGPA